MASGKLGLVVVLLVAVTLAEDDLEKDVLTEDEEGVVEEDMSLYTRLLQQTLKHFSANALSKILLTSSSDLQESFNLFPGTAPSCTEC